MKRLLVLSIFAALTVATQSEARVRAIGSFNTPEARAIGSFSPEVNCATGPSDICMVSKKDVHVSAGGFCQTCQLGR